jgi:hypothetical protein
MIRHLMREWQPLNAFEPLKKVASEILTPTNDGDARSAPPWNVSEC